MNNRRKICTVIFMMCVAALMLSGFVIHDHWTDNQNRAHQIAEIAREMGLPEDDVIIVRAQEIWWQEEAQRGEFEHSDVPVSDPEPVEDEPEVDPEPVVETEVKIPEIEIEEVIETESTDEPEPEEVKPTRYTLGIPGYTQEDIDRLASLVYNEAGNHTERRHKELVAACAVNRVNSPWLGSTIYEVITWPNQYLPAYAEYGSYYMNRAMEADNWEECKEIAEKALKGEIDCPYDLVFQAEFVQGRGVYESYYTKFGPTYFCYSLYTFDDPLEIARSNGLVE